MTAANNLLSIAHWAISHGYLFMFLAMCLEGPIVTAAAGFAASLGYFNPVYVLILAILGDLVPDTGYYLFGYVGRIALVERFENRLGLSRQRIGRLEELLKKHFSKTMITLKLTPVLAAPGFMIVGALRMPFKKFLKFCSYVTVPKALAFLFIGYYLGQVYFVSKFLAYGNFLLFGIFLIIVGIYIAYRIITKKLSKNIE